MAFRDFIEEVRGASDIVSVIGGDIELRPAPLLNGHALARLGAVAGPELGQLAQEMYIAQLEGELQTGEEAERWVRKWLIRHRESQE